MSENKIIKLVQDGKVEEAVQLIWGSGWVHPFDMPKEVERIATDERVEVQALKKGDCVHAYVKSKAMRIVIDVSRKTKYVHVTFEDGGKAQFDVDTELTVTRMVNNQEHVRLESIDYELKRMVRTACSSRAAAEEATSDVDVDSWLYHKLEAAAGATIRWQLWSRVLAHVSSEMTFLEALAYTAQTCEEELLENRLKASSTNQWSNLYEDKQREVYSDFVSKGYGSGWSAVRYSVGQLFGFGTKCSTSQVVDELVKRTVEKYA